MYNMHARPLYTCIHKSVNFRTRTHTHTHTQISDTPCMHFLAKAHHNEHCCCTCSSSITFIHAGGSIEVDRARRVYIYDTLSLGHLHTYTNTLTTFDFHENVCKGGEECGSKTCILHVLYNIVHVFFLMF